MTEDKYPYRPLTDDAAFFLTFADNALLTKLLRAILPDASIKEIVENNYQQQIADLSDSKDIRLDILAKDSDGRLYDLEMQRSDDNNLGQRMRYYTGKIDVDYVTLPKGKDYKSIPDVTIIFICEFNPFKDLGDNRSLHVFHVYEDSDGSEETLKLLTGWTGIIFNLKADWRNQNITADLKSTIAVLNQDYTSQPTGFAKEIKDKLDIVNSKEWRPKMTQILTKAGQIRAEGKAEGVVEGKAEAKLTFVLNLMNKYHFPLAAALEAAEVPEDEKQSYITKVTQLQEKQGHTNK